MIKHCHGNTFEFVIFEVYCICIYVCIWRRCRFRAAGRSWHIGLVFGRFQMLIHQQQLQRGSTTIWNSDLQLNCLHATKLNIRAQHDHFCFAGSAFSKACNICRKNLVPFDFWKATFVEVSEKAILVRRFNLGSPRSPCDCKNMMKWTPERRPVLLISHLEGE